jgi:hypothetical protein
MPRTKKVTVNLPPPPPAPPAPQPAIKVSGADKYKLANMPPVPAKNAQLTFGLRAGDHLEHLEAVRELVLDIRCQKKQDTTET